VAVPAQRSDELRDPGQPFEPPAGGTPTPPMARIPRRKRGDFGIVAWFCVAWLGLVVVTAVLADFLPVPDPRTTDIPNMLAPPLEGHGLLGTDGLGRDLLSRTIYGSRVSLLVALGAVSIGMLGGGLIGLLVGYFRGKLDTVVMGGVDVILAFPGLVLLLTVITWVGRSLNVIAIAIGLLAIPIYTRVSRANTLAVASREFVTAAKAMGATTGRVLGRELLPNVVPPLLAYALISIGIVIVLEGSLSFLGLSVEQPTPSWGGIINEGRRHLARAPHVSGVPSVVMFLTVLSLNIVGDKLRARFDVRGGNL
jgi:peptide/nickel transport system permease protein